MAARKETTLTGFGNVYGRPLLWGLIAGIGVILLLFAAFSLAASAAGAPVSMLPTMVVAALVLGGFSGGFVTARTLGGKGLIAGAMTGCVLALTVLIAMSIAKREIPQTGELLRGLILAVSAMIGGVAGIGQNPKRKRR